jgi:endonuclease YncB( thermonuclease family)
MVSKVLLVVAALTALAWPAGVAGQGVTAMVLSIGDGDTIRVRQAGKALTVRLACIDAPETAQGTYGQQARSYLQQRLPVGREIGLEVKTTDRYGRSVAEVIGKSRVNLAMVQSGQAFVYRQYLGRCDRGAYLAAERQAQAQRLGVWAVNGGITRPWDFRHGGGGQRRSGSTPAAATSSAPVRSP